MTNMHLYSVSNKINHKLRFTLSSYFSLYNNTDATYAKNKIITKETA